jgi:hypothetical protein
LDFFNHSRRRHFQTMIAEQKSLPLNAIKAQQAMETENEPAAAVPMDNSSTMFSPRSAAAMALSSISGRMAAVPPAPQQKALFAQLPVTKESPCTAAPFRPVLTQTSPPLHQRAKNAATMTNVAQESPPFTAQAPNYGEIIGQSTERKMVNAQRVGCAMTGPTTLNSSPPEPQYLSSRQQQQRPSPPAVAPPRNVGVAVRCPPNLHSTVSYRAAAAIATGPHHADFLPPPWTPPTWNQSSDYRHHHHHQYHPPPQPVQQPHHHHHPLSSSLGHNG